MKQHFFIALASTFTLAASGFADAPASGTVTIQDIDYSGQGCPQGSVATNLSDDGQAMTVLFDDYVVESEGRPDRKSCELDIELAAPAGWTFGLFCVDVRGYASLDNNVTGRQSVEYSFGRRRGPFGQGRGRSLEVGNVTLQGPVDQDYSNLTVIPVETLVWAPCGQTQERTLKIKTEVSIAPSRTRGRAGGGLMTVDSVDGELSHHYGIAWRRCPGNGGNNGGNTDLSGFSSSKTLRLGGNLGSCTNEWQSTSDGRLVITQNECASAAQRASRIQRRIIEARVDIWQRLVEVEFEQWQRQRGFRR